MKIPSKITIAGIEYEINKYSSDSPEMHYGTANGYIDYEKTIINLNKNLNEQSIEISLIHELTHSVLLALNIANKDITTDERFVESFSQLWYQIIKQL